MKRKFLSFLVGLLVVALTTIGFDYVDLESWQGKVSAGDISKRIEKYLQKDPSIEGYYYLDDEYFKMYSQAGDTTPEFTLRMAKKSKHHHTKPPTTLHGLRIALDPGHLGGEMAYLEDRYVDMSTNGKSFDEGSLNVLTAKYLQDLLVEAGAKVMLTKDKPSQSVYNKPFYQWLEEDFQAIIQKQMNSIPNKNDQKIFHNYWIHKASLTNIFRKFYNPLDLETRITKINDFNPDMTVIIHYNIGGTYDPSTGQNIGTDNNTALTFVPGAFMKGELSEKSARIAFARLAITDDLDSSIALSKKIADAFVVALGVSTPEDNYLANCTIKAAPGVLCRNLRLSRLVRGTICYGETLFQDNFEESERLASPDHQRIKEVAQAYYQGIINSLDKK